MNTAAKLCAYGAVLAVAFGGSWAAGSAVGPLTSSSAQAHAGHPDQANSEARDTNRGTTTGTPQGTPAGLASTSGGYTLAPTTTLIAPGSTDEFSFRITGPDGLPVTRFDTEHDKQMHLIVVRRDTAGYQHIHPEMNPDGTWHVPLRFADGGTYRVFADFAPTGSEAQTLGVDVSAPGTFTPLAPQPSRIAEVDGYQVRLDGDLVAGTSSPVTLTVSKDGRPVSNLQPYLAAYGHLVALRTSDLAYLHVHPTGTPGDGRTPAGPGIAFQAEVPSDGTYRLFLDFQHEGKVRTAEFTVAAQQVSGRQSPPPADDGHGGHG
ncbi:hypothetical protein REH65_32970 [Saccharopolyspora sp. ID03-671]|uniref:hypothetical protein n=1 Tax=Saccharopolyspora sp. ID03-671 TaxID=3073066 RepID=UPI0032466459